MVGMPNQLNFLYEFYQAQAFTGERMGVYISIHAK